MNRALYGIRSTQNTSIYIYIYICTNWYMYIEIYIYIPVDAYAQLLAECSIEGQEHRIVKVAWCQRDIRLGIFITT